MTWRAILRGHTSGGTYRAPAVSDPGLNPLILVAMTTSDRSSGCLASRAVGPDRQ